MLNPNLILRQQLKKILSSINKKHTTLRKQLQKTIQVFQTHLPIFPYQVLSRLFHHIIQSNSLTSSLIFFPFIQDIINLGFAHEEMVKEIIALVNHARGIHKFHGVDNSHKVQTIVMLLVGKNAVHLDNLKFAHSLVNILFSLENAKSKSVWMKTTSAINQILLLFINQLKETDKFEQMLIIFNKFVFDIVSIAKGQQPQWLIQLPQQYICLNLVSQLLDQKYIHQHRSEHAPIFHSLIPTLRKSIQKISLSSLSHLPHQQRKSSSLVWQLTQENCLILLMRVSCKLSRLYCQGFQILQEIIKIITQKGRSNIKFIGYEAINFLFSNCQWLNIMLNTPSGDLFNFLMTTLFNNVKFILAQYKDKIDLNVQYQIERAGKLFQGHFVDFTVFQLLPVIQLKMIIKNIQQITFTLYSTYSQIYKMRMQKSIPLQQSIPLQKTYKFCQKTVFQISKSLIPRQMPQDVLQSLLKTCQKFITLSGILNDNTTSTMYMKLLCKYCLPLEFKNIQHRHVQINKMILNIANCLGNLFSTGCWAIVWRALENYNKYYNRYLLGKEDLEKDRRTDVEILYKSIDSIFTESHKYEDEYLLKILRSLIQVTYECLQNNFTDESKKIFAFQRIQQIYKLNLFRIPIIWPQLSSSLLCITTSKVSYFRLSALNLLNTLIPLSLHYIKTHPQILSSNNVFSQNKIVQGKQVVEKSIDNSGSMLTCLPLLTLSTFQTLLLQPWRHLSTCPFPQIRSQLCVCVNKLIIDYGHIMQKGWESILEIIKNTKDIKSLQAIVQTYLDKISDSVMQTIAIIDMVQRGLLDMNHKYLCLTLIWAIGDHCHKHSQNQALRKIYQMLLQPDQMFVIGMEARHSSFYIFAEIIVHNCSEKEEHFWKWIFVEINNFYTFAMKKCYERKDTINCQEQLKNIFTNLIKIYRRLFSVSKQFKTNDLILSQLDNFYKLASDMLRFRQSQIYQMVLKQTKQILTFKTQQSLSRVQFWNFLESFSQIYYVQNDNKILKCLITYLPSEMYQILFRALPQISTKLCIIYHLVQKIFLLRLQSQQKDIKLSSLRIFFQQKPFLQFLKKLHTQILSLQPITQHINLISLYLENLIKTTHKLLLYEDYYYVQKMLGFLGSFVEKFGAKLVLTDLLGLIRNIVYLKYDQTWRHKFIASKEVPVWYIATQELIKYGYQFNTLQLKDSYYQVYSIFQKMVNQLQHKQQNHLQPNCSSQNLALFHQNYLQILNFFANCYFLNENFQIQQQQIDKIAKTIASQASYDQKDKSNKSKNTYDLLFKLGEVRLQKQIYINPKITSRQSIFIKYLFKRVQLSFKTFQSHKKQLNLQKKTNYQSQIKYILKKLLHLQLKQNILQQKNCLTFLIQNHQDKHFNMKAKVLLNKHSHLFYFYQYIIKCIQSDNKEIRDIVADIIRKIGNQIFSIS